MKVGNSLIDIGKNSADVSALFCTTTTALPKKSLPKPTNTSLHKYPDKTLNTAKNPSTKVSMIVVACIDSAVVRYEAVSSANTSSSKSDE
jgi:hypothetical protein